MVLLSRGGLRNLLAPSEVFTRQLYIPSQVVDGTGTVGGEFTLVSGSDTSTPLAFNASAVEVAEAVNAIRSWEGLVLVDRQELLSSGGNDSGDGYEGDLFEWRLTFPPAEGDVEELRVRKFLSIYLYSMCERILHWATKARAPACPLPDKMTSSGTSLRPPSAHVTRAFISPPPASLFCHDACQFDHPGRFGVDFSCRLADL